MKDLSMHIMDIVQNSISANANMIEVIIVENPHSNDYSLYIHDNGKGMSEEVLQNVSDPYYTTRTTRKVGLGIPLLKQNTERTGGIFNITSAIGKGTSVEAHFIYNNIDRLPIGDIAGTMAMLASANPKLDFVYKHTTAKETYVFDTREVKEALDGVPISELAVVKYLKEMINENLNEIEISK